MVALSVIDGCGIVLGRVMKSIDMLMRKPDVRGVRNRLKLACVKGRVHGKVIYGKGVIVEKGVEIRVDAGGYLEIGDYAMIRKNSDIRVVKGGQLFIGRKTVIGTYCLIRCRKEIRIEANVAIGPNNKLIDHVHALSLRGRVPDAYWSKSIRLEEGSGTFSDVFVALGAKIGKYSKIGEKSTVNSALPASSYCTGNPCVVIKTDPRVRKKHKD